MKSLFSLCIALLLVNLADAQNLNKSIEIGSAKIINITSDYPSVEVHTAEGNEIIIEGHVYRNGIPLNDVVKVKWNGTTSTLSFETDIELAKNRTNESEPQDLDKLSKEELKELIKSRRKGMNFNGHNYYDGKYNWNLETHMVIYLPKSVTEVSAEMVYGSFEMDHRASDITIFNKYGKIDIETSTDMNACSLESTYANVSLSTPNDVPTDYRLQSNYGEIFTDIDLSVDRKESTHEAYKTIIIGNYKNGGDQSIKMRSDYANIYLRKL